MSKVKKIIVGITGNEQTVASNDGKPYDLVSRHISRAVVKAGALPVIIPVGSIEESKEYIPLLDKLILSGGQHVDPLFYDEQKEHAQREYNLERDQFELALINEAIKQEKPLLGICRGMQLINVALGGSLHQTIKSHWQNGVQGTSHSISIEEGSQLATILPNGFETNSFHLQSINRLGDSLMVTARDPRDGTIEAVESSKYTNVLGVQWHPELLLEERGNQNLFNYFIQKL